MNTPEARSILADEMSRLRAMSHADLQKLIGSPQVVERAGPGGAAYQIEIEVFWDDPRQAGGALRVLGASDDGGLLPALSLLCADFIIEPDRKTREESA